MLSFSSRERTRGLTEPIFGSAVLVRARRGVAREIQFCVIIETNQGLERAVKIAKSSTRIDSVILGAVDMSAELRCEKE